MKICLRCRTEKPLSDFSLRKASRDGHNHWCRSCASDYHKEWYGQNREEWKKRVRDAARSNPEPNRERAKKWRADNPERARESHRKSKAVRRDREKAAFKERVSWVQAWEKQKGCCGECGEPIDRSLKFPDLMRGSHDHIVPISRGGLHEQSNVQWTHLYCNMLKGAKV